MSSVIVAAVQLNSGDDEEQNWARVQALARRARERGAALVAFPENLLYEGPDANRRHPLDVWGPRFGGLAKELEIVLVAGTVREPAGARAFNTCTVYGPDGEELARYRKLHLFDVDVPHGHKERESDYVQPGDGGPVVVDLPGLGPVGLAVCYDLRFPELFRELVQRGARTVIMPTSFALGTGKDHWIPLCRARAIENQVFFIAPDQFGKKPHGRVKFGKTLIVDPWGQIMGCAREVDEDLVVCELDFEHQDRVRQALPCLDHRRM